MRLYVFRNNFFLISNSIDPSYNCHFLKNACYPHLYKFVRLKNIFDVNMKHSQKNGVESNFNAYDLTTCTPHLNN